VKLGSLDAEATQSEFLLSDTQPEVRIAGAEHQVRTVVDVELGTAQSVVQLPGAQPDATTAGAGSPERRQANAGAAQLDTLAQVNQDHIPFIPAVCADPQGDVWHFEI
jgi:hypothetical protein